jgi:hypothetical protein
MGAFPIKIKKLKYFRVNHAKIPRGLLWSWSYGSWIYNYPYS